MKLLSKIKDRLTLLRNALAFRIKQRREQKYEQGWTRAKRLIEDIGIDAAQRYIQENLIWPGTNVFDEYDQGMVDCVKCTRRNILREAERSRRREDAGLQQPSPMIE